MGTTKKFEALWQDLIEARDEHGVRAATLLPDLAFIGLLDDFIDATETAMELLLGQRPHRAYVMVRVAFEAVQRLLVLAAADDYMRLGTRAWLYYQAKDSQFRMPLLVEGELTEEEQVVRLWERYSSQARPIVAEQREALAKAKGPDNFVGRNLAECAEEAYARLAPFRKGNPDPKTKGVDKSLYSFLCRDSHACLRLDPRGFSVRRTGEVEVFSRTRDPSTIRRNVFKGLKLCLRDAVIAVEYRISARNSMQPQQLANPLRQGENALPPDFLPDLGLELMRLGKAETPIRFPGVPVHHVKELPDGALSFSVSDSEPPRGHTATFDFRGDQREVLLRRLGNAVRPPTLEGTRPIDIRLQEPMVLTITAVLGAPQQTETEEFVPFNVIMIE